MPTDVEAKTAAVHRRRVQRRCHDVSSHSVVHLKCQVWRLKKSV